MEGHAEMEMLRTLKGPSTGEVSVHLVARDSPGSGPHLPSTAFIIPGGPNQGSGEEGHSQICQSRCGSWGEMILFTCLHTCMAGLGQSHRAHLRRVCSCICSQPALPPLACPAVLWMCPAFRGNRSMGAPRSECQAAYLSLPPFCRS